MGENSDTATRYRQRAEELRVIASDGGEVAATLLQIAADYDRMADTLEAIEKTNGGLNKPRQEI
jgi:hypothetical protein